MEKILTIVVPAYNAEAYLEYNLNSFLHPSILNDIEVLIINDGSTDRTGSIAQNFVNRYPQTYRLISKENGGHGSGINLGIRLASGKYLKIVDSDDWVNPKQFVSFVHFLKHQDADIVHSGFLWIYEYDKQANNRRIKPEIREPFANVKYGHVYAFNEVANQLYIKIHSMTLKTEILRLMCFPIDEKCFYVDTEFIIYPIPYIKTICFFNGFVYMYRLHGEGQSVDIHKMQENIHDYDRVLNSIFKYYRLLGNQIPCSLQKKTYIAKIIARTISGKMKILLSYTPSSTQKKRIIAFDQKVKKYFPEIYNQNINPAIKFLRLSNYSIYYPLCWIVRKKYHF